MLSVSCWQLFVSGVVGRSRLVMHVLYTSLAIFRILCNQLDSNLANLEATCSWIGINSGVSFSNNAMHYEHFTFFKFHKVVWRHYTGEVETFIRFCSKCIRKTTYQISPELPKFYRRHYKEYFSLFFPHTVYSICKTLTYGPCVTRGAHSFTCHPHTNHTCLYSPAARRHRPFFGWYSLRLPTKGWPGWVDLGGWLHTEMNVPHRELNLDMVTHPSTNRARRRLTSLIEINALPPRQTAKGPVTKHRAVQHKSRTWGRH